MRKKLELYIHIPFCIKKCEYCDFLSGPANLQRQREYVDALCKEIQASEGYETYEVSSIFFGGGTPSILPGEWLAEIMKMIYQRFHVLENAEISIEANPGTVTEEKLFQYCKAGVNRISFGCQSTNNQELKMLGRIHTWEEFLDSFQMARNAGFTNINVDLMSGLPSQSLQTWENSLKKVAMLGVEHISAYSLIIEDGTPFAEYELDLPDEEEERKMYENTAAILKQYGYHQYEISNYAKEGYACRHNCGYWNRTEYLGLGLGSASLVNEVRFSNISDMDFYLKYSGEPSKLREDMQELSENEQMEEFMFLGLRMLEGVSSDSFFEKFGKKMENVYDAVIQKYVDLGLLEWNANNLRLTRRGISVSNQIFADFLF